VEIVPFSLPESIPSGEVSVVIERVALGLRLEMAIRTNLKSHPTAIHWHFRRPRTTGTLEITYDPISRQAWFSTRPGRTKAWVYEAMQAISAEINSNSGVPEP
jgi:hypothetical protein